MTVQVSPAESVAPVQASLSMTKSAGWLPCRPNELIVKTRLRQQGDVVVEVTDTGEGIPEELLPRIWQVYYSRRRTGTGLGLPTTRRIVEDHDGTIQVVSEVGRGTQFTIRLPAETEED